MPKLAQTYTCLGERFGINIESAFLKISKFPEENKSNFKIFKVDESDLSQKLAEQNMWLMVNHTKLANTLYGN